MKKQKFADLDLSWVLVGKTPDQMTVAELMGDCPSCGGSYDQRGECPYCGDTLSPEQIVTRRQWLKEHPEEK